MTRQKRLHRFGVIALIMGTFLGFAAGPASADSTPGRMVAPTEAQQAALGLLDAGGDLGLQCGMSKLADRLRARTVPLTVAVKTAQTALRVAKAKKGCSAAVKVGAAVASILVIAETGNAVYLEIDHAKKFKFPVWKCTETIRVGTSEALAVPFKFDYTCW